VSAPRTIRGRGIVKGRAQGEVLISQEPISFLGDVDIGTGRVVGALPSVKDRSLAGKVLVFPSSMGSAGAWRFLYQLYRHGTHPVALICRELPDPSVVQGAILAHIPVVCAPEEDLLATLDEGDHLAVDGAGSIEVYVPS
jgi:predicted aconitase with swiveling domain